MDDVDAFVAAFHAAEGLQEPYDKAHWRHVRWVVAKPLCSDRSDWRLSASVRRRPVTRIIAMLSVYYVWVLDFLDFLGDCICQEEL